MKQLHRSKTNRVIGGLLGGVGEYFNVDPTLLRLGFVVMTVFTGIVPGLLVYFFGVLLVPLKPNGTPPTHESH